MGSTESLLLRCCRLCTVLVAVGTCCSFTCSNPTADGSSDRPGRTDGCFMSSVSTAAIPKAHPYPLGSLKCPFGRNPYRVCTEPLGPSRRDASAAQFSEAHFGPHRSQSLRAPTHHRNSKDKQQIERGIAMLHRPRPAPLPTASLYGARCWRRSRTASRLRLSVFGTAVPTAVCRCFSAFRHDPSARSSLRRALRRHRCALSPTLLCSSPRTRWAQPRTSVLLWKKESG